MKRPGWRKKITAAMIEAGTYKPFFDLTIDTLAGILERRDETEVLYKKSGGMPIVKHTNKGGSTNLEQNPALRLINDLNRDALQYWRDMGLTPAGFKRLSEEAMTGANDQRSELDKVLSNLEM